jgi:hypothetical protein
MSGTLGVLSASTLSGTLDVYGAMTVRSGLTAYTSLAVSGNTTLSGSLTIGSSTLSSLTASNYNQGLFVTPGNSITSSSQWTTISGQFNASGYVYLSMPTMVDYTNYNSHTIIFQGYHTFSVSGVTNPYLGIGFLTASGTSMGVGLESTGYTMKRNSGLVLIDVSNTNTYFLLTDTSAGCPASVPFYGSVTIPNPQLGYSFVRGQLHYMWTAVGNSQSFSGTKLTSSNQIGGLQFQFITTNYATTTYFATLKYSVQSV